MHAFITGGQHIKRIADGGRARLGASLGGSGAGAAENESEKAGSGAEKAGSGGAASGGEADAGLERVVETHDRTLLRAMQTPQGFRKEILLEANRHADEDGFLGTDDASLVERIGVPVHIVRGEYSNIKVTTPEDMVVAEAILRNDMGAGELMKTAVHEAKRLLGGVVRRRRGDGE